MSFNFCKERQAEMVSESSPMRYCEFRFKLWDKNTYHKQKLWDRN